MVAHIRLTRQPGIISFYKNLKLDFELFELFFKDFQFFSFFF